MEKLEQFRDPLLETSGERIGFYTREFYVLDNFSAFQVDWQGRRWATVEHAYQAAKFLDKAPEVVDLIQDARSAHDAKKIARSHADKVPEKWDEIKVAIMEDICLNKLLQHPYVMKKLLDTGDLEIVEDSPDDDFWGWGPNRDGQNVSGKIWMALRERLRSGEIQPA